MTEAFWNICPQSNSPLCLVLVIWEITSQQVKHNPSKQGHRPSPKGLSKAWDKAKMQETVLSPDGAPFRCCLWITTNYPLAAQSEGKCKTGEWKTGRHKLHYCFDKRFCPLKTHHFLFQQFYFKDHHMYKTAKWRHKRSYYNRTALFIIPLSTAHASPISKW
jgi:hypothetical protein